MTQQNLDLGATGPVPEHQHDDMQWVFDFPPPSGRRTGGDLAEFAFDATLDVLVREVIQNALDQRRNDAPVEVAFNLIEYQGDELDTLLAAMRWSELRPHLEGAAQRSPRFERGLHAVHSGRVLGLWIEDRGTSGLRGKETGDGNFATLCRDRLFSHKNDASAGGSYGLGKAVLWRFSQWSTVAFVSNPCDVDPTRGPRAIAKASLPFHQSNAEDYDGDGWLGRRESVKGGDRAVSLWGPPARSLAQRLGALRGNEPGTSILICGFEDPAGEQDDPTETAARIAEAADEHFWPALEKGSLVVRTAANGRSVEARAANTQPMRALYRRYLEGSAGRSRIPVQVDLPACKDGSHRKLTAEIDVLVEPVDSERDGDHAREIVGFRSTGMVVMRDRLPALNVDGSFRAIVVSGGARVSTEPTDWFVERFLREAEPPAHDQWKVTPRLKDRYSAGYARALSQLHSRVRAAVRSALTPLEQVGSEGPEALQRLFRIGNSGGGRAESDFHFPTLHAERSGEDWLFEATIRPRKPTLEPWWVALNVVALEQGGPGKGGLIAKLEADVGTVTLDRGSATVALPAGTVEANVLGVCPADTLPSVASKTRIKIELRGGAE